VRTCLGCGEARIEPSTHPDTRVCRKCELERQAAEPPPPAVADEREDARDFIASSGWRLATTMLDIPHQYTVRDLATPDASKTTAAGHARFEWFVALIRRDGTRKRWGRYQNTYLVVDEWEYWTMGYPVEETTIVNRQAVGPRAVQFMESAVTEARRSSRGRGRTLP